MKTARPAALPLALFLLLSPAHAKSPAANEYFGYLFAHMTKDDYGRLYYALSRDGLHWQLLNGGRRVSQQYRGHPDVCRGHDGRYYLIGNCSPNRDVALWTSPDLVTWSRFGSFEPDVNRAPDFKSDLRYHGAPKIFFDGSTGQYLITWHTPTERGDKNDPEKHWASMRTLYVTSRDLTSFSDPKRLFPFDMATIDVIVRREGDRYYAVLKDERYPSFDWPTGKSIRISSAPTLAGPWTEPGPRITPNFREAPTLIPRPDGQGWYLYCEQYPGVQYGLCTAPSLGGPWYDVYIGNYDVPDGARHGCMVPLTEDRYDDLVEAYGDDSLKK